MRTAHVQKQSPTGQVVIEILLESAADAEARTAPTCQDTGMAILFVYRIPPLVMVT